MIEHRVVFAARNIGETCQISEYGSRPILAKDMQESALRWELIRLEIATNGCQRLSQFLPVATVAPIAKRAEPVVTLSLADDGACPHYLPALAPKARQEHRPHPTGERLGVSRRSGVRRVGGRPRACHQCQTPPSSFLLDPPGPRFASHSMHWRGGG